MSEITTTESELIRNRQALSIVRFILELPVLHARAAKAARFNMPLGSVLGPKVSLLDLDLNGIEQDVNASIRAIGGIPAIIEDDQSVTHMNLIEWRGPLQQDPAVHSWVGQIADNRAHVSAPIRGVESDLINRFEH